ncbi:MAG: LOG family protein [Verrucomicrobia bacterium]|nr:LOG family protein [Verrucomicrobiota bacterium]
MSNTKKRPRPARAVHDEDRPVTDLDYTGGFIHDLPGPSEHLGLGQESFEERVAKLVKDWGCNGKEPYIAELINTALKLAKDGSEELDLKIVNRAVKEMRYANRVFLPYRKRRKVTVFGSARTQPGDPEYQAAVAFCQRMSEHGFMTITGAGPGIMEAGNRGAGPDNSFGLRIQLPFEAGANSYIEGDPKLINFKYFFTRKLSFVKEAHAAALFPGGFGTMDEGFETMTLIQTGKAIIFPIVMIDAPGGLYWQDFRDFITNHLLRLRLISEEDLDLFKVTDSVDEAVEAIVGFYRIFHSYRYVRDKLVIRLNQPISPAAVLRLNDEHGDFLLSGRYELSAPLPAEADQPEIASLPRLVCTPRRSHYGKMRKMLDALNHSEIAS